MKKIIKNITKQAIVNTKAVKGGQSGSGTRKAASSAQTQPKLL